MRITHLDILSYSVTCDIFQVMSSKLKRKTSSRIGWNQEYGENLPPSVYRPCLPILLTLYLIFQSLICLIASSIHWFLQQHSPHFPFNLPTESSIFLLHVQFCNLHPVYLIVPSEIYCSLDYCEDAVLHHLCWLYFLINGIWSLCPQCSSIVTVISYCWLYTVLSVHK